MQTLVDNAPRIQPPLLGVESWFLRANDPRSPRSAWIKVTVLVRPDGDDLAEAWCCLFDGDRTAAFRVPSDLGRALFDGGEDRPLEMAVAGTRMQLEGAGGSASGRLRAEEEVSWDLHFEGLSAPLGASLCIFPSRSLLDSRFPKGKLVTPFPVARVQGRIQWEGATWDLRDWVGMQGHNWGSAHTHRYAWGQCVFLDDQGSPEAVVEAISARVKAGPVITPTLSLLTARFAGHELRFDRVVDLWGQKAELEFPEWRLEMRSSEASAQLLMRGRPERMVCLGYDNPKSPRSHCLNSKTAFARLVVDYRGERYSFESAHGGALEFLQLEPDPRVQPVV